MKIEKNFTCVVCPIGCALHAEYDEGNPSSCRVTGNSCPRGEKYAKNEIVSPERTLTGTVKIRSEWLPMLPVKTSAPIPKDLMFEAMRILRGLSLDAPVKQGDVVYRDFLKPGIDLVACRTVDR